MLNQEKIRNLFDDIYYKDIRDYLGKKFIIYILLKFFGSYIRS